MKHTDASPKGLLLGDFVTVIWNGCQTREFHIER